jgi:hypothetical protein
VNLCAAILLLECASSPADGICAANNCARMNARVE